MQAPRHSKPKVGRPRLRARESNQEVADEILEVAARLFSQQGYERTSTREIADQVGLKQGSLFYYFARKSDLLTALLNRTLQPTIELVSWLDVSASPPDAALFALVRADVQNICGRRTNSGSLMYLPAVKAPEFKWFWEKRAQLEAVYRGIVRRGIEDGILRAGDANLMTAQVFGLVESTIQWFDRRGSWSVEMVAREIARTSLRMTLADIAMIDDVEKRAATFKAPPGSDNPEVSPL